MQAQTNESQSIASVKRDLVLVQIVDCILSWPDKDSCSSQSKGHKLQRDCQEKPFLMQPLEELVWNLKLIRKLIQAFAGSDDEVIDCPDASSYHSRNRPRRKQDAIAHHAQALPNVQSVSYCP